MDGSFAIPASGSGAGFIPGGPADHAFRRAIDDFLDTELTAELRRAGRETTGLKTERAARKAWAERLHAQGWLAQSWPVEHGGAGWSADQRLYFENASAARDAPLLMSSGIRTIGPLIIAEGSDAQKARYLPPILSGEDEWCQGFSEPQAGSDLSTLALSAERDGDEFVLNGSKVWTSFAQEATHMFLLARSERGSKRHDGLVFLLVEMDRPGIEVRPIRFIDGDSETNEVFFDNVRTPAADRIGAIGEGWATAKRLMEIARGNNTTTGLLRRAFRAACRHAAAAGPLDAQMQMALAGIGRRIDEFEALEARLAAGQVGVDAAPASSLMKLAATELHQAITEVGLSLDPQGAYSQRKYLSTRAATIYSGTSEVHRNILSKALQRG